MQIISKTTMSSRILGLTGPAARRRSTAIIQRRFQSSSTDSGQFARSAQRTAAARVSIANNRKTVYVVAGSTIALGLFGLTRSRSDYVDDPRDVRALSSLPMGKLCSGWM